MRYIPIIFIALLPTIVMADDLYTNDIIGGCGDAYYYKAILEPISYTCASGQYLPAGALSCEQCPDTHTCNGGTFTFDANHTQGLSYGDVLITNAIGSCSKEFTQNYSAVFEPITYNCPAGYYLPAGNDWVNDEEGCRVCPQNNKCIGGTYYVNETNDQGIEPCPNDNKYAPSGSSVCYPRRMHIDEGIYVYLKSTPSTDPALNVNVNGTMYHANLVRDEIPMNKDTDRFLPVTINGIMYFACDDTSCPSGE